mgnify:CR=1 FL=1
MLGTLVGELLNLLIQYTNMFHQNTCEEMSSDMRDHYIFQVPVFLN